MKQYSIYVYKLHDIHGGYWYSSDSKEQIEAKKDEVDNSDSWYWSDGDDTEEWGEYGDEYIDD